VPDLDVISYDGATRYVRVLPNADLVAQNRTRTDPSRVANFRAAPYRYSCVDPAVVANDRPSANYRKVANKRVTTWSPISGYY